MSDSNCNSRRSGDGKKPLNLTEIKRRADIRDVWTALGGAELRGNRGRAFWRDGDGYNVSLDPPRGLWHDFVSGEGGDVIRLIEIVQGCDFKQACAWLANFTGMSPIGDSAQHFEADTDWPADLRWATWWRIAAVALAEEALATLESCDPQRRIPTVLLATLRLGDAALVAEYRAWRRQNPELTAAMARAGQRSDARIQHQTALDLRRYLDETA